MPSTAQPPPICHLCVCCKTCSPFVKVNYRAKTTERKTEFSVRQGSLILSTKDQCSSKFFILSKSTRSLIPDWKPRWTNSVDWSGTSPAWIKLDTPGVKPCGYVCGCCLNCSSIEVMLDEQFRSSIIGRFITWRNNPTTHYMYFSLTRLHFPQADISIHIKPVFCQRYWSHSQSCDL